MKIKDVQSVTKVYECLQQNMPINDELMQDFSTAVDNFNDIINRQKLRYDANIEMYKIKSREWRDKNREKRNAYQREYMKRDYVKKRVAERKRIRRQEAKGGKIDE